MSDALRRHDGEALVAGRGEGSFDDSDHGRDPATASAVDGMPLLAMPSIGIEPSSDGELGMPAVTVLGGPLLRHR
jgi:hypothetical protein